MHDMSRDVFPGPPSLLWRFEKKGLAPVDRKRFDSDDRFVRARLRLRDIREANHVIYISSR
jgi:molybdopterin-biosynthesis enzyme MoeA-like protein